jgi:hypothetical protein
MAFEQPSCCPIARNTRGRLLSTPTRNSLVPSVGDSHKGPLNNQGKPAYLHKKQRQTNLKTRVRWTHGPTAHQTDGLATLGRNSTSLEGHGCRMDLPGPTTSVGTRTDYSVGPWDYPACATRHLLAWSTRTMEEKYSVRKLYMSRTVWKTPRRTRLVLSPYSDL